MTKTFREILAENDDEFVYLIRSTVEIHNPELFERVRMSVLPYQIKSIEIDGYKPIGKNNPYFPDQPHSPTYTIRVVTGLKISKGFKATLAMETRIHVSHLRIDGDQDVELVNEPEDVSSKKAQEMVGQRRIAAFIKELEGERKKRQKLTQEREVYECYTTTHRGMEDLLGKPLRKGYYIVEAIREDDKNILEARGPFDVKPEGLYRDRIRAVGTKVINESSATESYSVKVEVEDVELR